MHKAPWFFHACLPCMRDKRALFIPNTTQRLRQSRKGANGILNGWVLSPKGKSILLSAVDGNKRPLFINSAAEGAVPMILGSRAVYSKGAYVSGTPEVVGFAGDWTQAVYGTVEGVKVAISDQATLTDGGTTINLFEQNMFAVRAEIEVGFRCDTTVFNKLTRTTS